MRPPRRKQSRLTFTPLSSSSPAAKGYPKKIQERAAAVGYDDLSSPAKRRKLRAPKSDNVSFGKAQMDDANDLPTPAATMGRGDSASSDEAPVTSTKLTSRKRSRRQQRQLDFIGARESSSFSSPVRLASSPRPQSTRAGMFSTQTRRSQRQRAAANVSTDESDRGDASPADELPVKSQLKRRSSQRPVVIDSDDDEASDNITVSASKAQTTAVSDEETGDEETGDDDDMPTTQGKLPRIRKKRNRSRDNFISSSPPRAIESDSDLEIIEKPRSTRGRRQQPQSDYEDDDTPLTPSRRQLKRPRQMSRQEQADLDEDLDFLGPSSDVEALERQPRSTQSKQKSARQAALKNLKRKRSGQPLEVEEEGVEAEGSSGEAEDVEDGAPQPTSRNIFRPSEDDDAFIDSDPDADDTLGIPDAVMPLAFTRQASSKPKRLFKHAVEWFVQKKINPGFNMHDELYELTFRKLDDEVQGLAGSKFKSAAWTPAFTAAITSRPEIAFEELDRTTDEHYLNDKCDACNRSGHPATFQIQFQGKPYHPQTLEEVGGNDGEDDEDEDASSSEEGGEDDDDQPAYDYRGNEVPPANTIYHVGKFCKANAEMGMYCHDSFNESTLILTPAHELQHWRYHLNQYAILWMTRNGYLTNEKIVKRDQQSTKKRRREADKITDHMGRDGEIKALWEAYRKKIDDARTSKQGRFVAGL